MIPIESLFIGVAPVEFAFEAAKSIPAPEIIGKKLFQIISKNE
jgi:hypothetical protein